MIVLGEIRGDVVAVVRVVVVVGTSRGYVPAVVRVAGVTRPFNSHPSNHSEFSSKCL